MQNIYIDKGKPKTGAPVVNPKKQYSVYGHIIMLLRKVLTKLIVIGVYSLH